MALFKAASVGRKEKRWEWVRRARMADDEPLIDRIGTRNVNLALGIVYLALLGWGLAVFLLIPIHAGATWPLSFAFAYQLTTAGIHFGFIGIGAILVPQYVYYPVAPKRLYQLTDAVILVLLVSVLLSYILANTSSTVPLVTTWLLQFALGVQLYKIYSLVFGSARDVELFTSRSPPS